MSLENENMNESQAREAARREYIEKFTWHDDAVIAAYVEENWRRFASAKPIMTIPPADDEQIAAMEECLDGRTVWDDDHIARLIARIRADRAELAALRKFAKDATIALTGLTSGGSEFFAGQMGDIYVADIPRCVERVRERYETGSRLTGDAIRRIRAEREKAGWQPIETAPHACTFLATYWSDDFGEWTVGLVMRPLDGPWTHWRPLPTPPALSQEERT